MQERGPNAPGQQGGAYLKRELSSDALRIRMVKRDRGKEGTSTP